MHHHHDAQESVSIGLLVVADSTCREAAMLGTPAGPDFDHPGP